MKNLSFSFKKVAQVINHCRSLAQFASFLKPSKLPLLDFDLNALELADYLALCRTYSTSKTFYLIYRTHGFDYFRHSAPACLYKKDYHSSFVASYTITYSVTEDLFFVEPIELI